MYEIFRVSKPYMETVASAFDLTPQQVYALKSLREDRALAMSEFATALGCDASNVTAIVDKLEMRGLVERRSSDHDRRVKAILLTEAGLELRGRLHERMQQPPPVIESLSEADLNALNAILARALASLE